MSKHCHHDDCCCHYPAMYGISPVYGGAGYGAVGTGYGVYNGSSWGIRWIYALLILIVIVLQFGRKTDRFKFKTTDVCCDDGIVADKTAGGFFGADGLIDNSVLFIIVVFLLVICAGCWFGSGFGGGYTSGGYGGYGY